ncbi:MAG TPA: hypothetical protein VM509_01475, partial [Planctomycetota bacterium]|nr:hypothetical protein [Planctomycetota bacterium]
MRHPLSLGLAAIVGIVIGFTIATLVAIPMLGPEIVVPEPERRPVIDAVPKSTPEVEHVAARRSADEHGEEASSTNRAASEGLISAALRDYAREGIRTGWREARNEEIPDERLVAGTRMFEERLLALPKSIGTELAELKTREEQLAEDARRGGAFALLEGMAKGGTPVTALVSDAEQFEALFARGTPEITVRAESLGPDLTKHLESGKTYEYGVGVHELEIDLRGKDLPSDVTIAGAGMNRTLLVLKDDIFAASSLRRFSIRDCTVFTNNNYLFDQRGGPATILLERITVLGFDMGAGGSCALGFAGSTGLVLLARDCRFLGGYG